MRVEKVGPNGVDDSQYHAWRYIALYTSGQAIHVYDGPMADEYNFVSMWSDDPLLDRNAPHPDIVSKSFAGLAKLIHERSMD